MNVRPDWDEWALNLARVAATRAACTRRQTGAVILDRAHHVVGVGYNGVPSGDLHCTDGGCPRGRFTYAELPPYGSYADCTAVHAEVNAIRNSVADIREATCYVTSEPCASCYSALIKAGLVRAVWSEPGTIVSRKLIRA